MEYDSVKVVVTDEIEEMITHNIFYTAITRAKKELKIYWTPEKEKKVLSSLTKRNNGKDASGNWTTVTNGTPIIGVTVPSTLPAAFFRLQAL